MSRPLPFTNEKGKDFYLKGRPSKHGGVYYSRNITGSREPEYARYINVHTDDAGRPVKLSYQDDVGSKVYIEHDLSVSKSGKAYYAKTDEQFFLLLEPKEFTFKDDKTGAAAPVTSCRLSIVPPDYDFKTGTIKPFVPNDNLEADASTTAQAAPAKRGYSKS